MINCLQNPHASVFPNKWHFDLSQDWETLALNFDSFSTDDIADETLQALGFCISATGYLEEGSPYFIDVTDLELTTGLAVVDKAGQVVTNSQEEVVKKKNKCVAKRKKRLAKLRSPVRSLLFPCPESSLFLLPYLLPTPMPAFVFVLVPAFMPASISTPMPAAFSCLGSPVVLLSSRVSVPAAVSCRRIPALMSPLLVLGPPLPFKPLLLKTFKQFLSDEPQPRMSTSPVKPFCLFLAFGTANLDDNNSLYNLTNNNKRKRGFNTLFINSRLLADNHDQKKIDLSFAKCKYPATVKLNQLWQLDLLDL